MSHRRYALVGAGHRAQMYVDAITGRYRDDAALVAICEPNPVRAQYYVDRVVEAGFPAPAVYGPDDLEANGSFTDHEYTFKRSERVVATVSKRWFSWTDTYGVDIADGEDDILILARSVVVDMACHPDDGKRH